MPLVPIDRHRARSSKQLINLSLMAEVPLLWPTCVVVIMLAYQSSPIVVAAAADQPVGACQQLVQVDRHRRRLRHASSSSELERSCALCF